MKALTISSLALLAVVAVAASPPASPQDPPPDVPVTATTTDSSPPQEAPAMVMVSPPQEEVSPLVAAARRANIAREKGKSRITITNATLSKTGGHLTTWSATGTPPPYPEATGTAKHEVQPAAKHGKPERAEGARAVEGGRSRKRAAQAASAAEGAALDVEVEPGAPPVAPDHPAGMSTQTGTSQQPQTDSAQQTDTAQPPQTTTITSTMGKPPG